MVVVVVAEVAGRGSGGGGGGVGRALGIERRADGIAQNKNVLASRVVSLRREDTILLRGAHSKQLANKLDVSFVRAGVPKQHGRICAFRLRICTNKGVAKEAPAVVGADVCKVDVGVDRERDTQRAPLP